jgi:anionic cell wall polymer biosynthesis LytR-Cps2A-Psr (LCP) family protein
MLNGTEEVAQAIFDNFAITPDHYVTIEADYITLIDAIGGIDVQVPSSHKAGGYIFRSGLQHFDGDMTAAYLSSYEEETEWERQARQDSILKGIQNSIMSPSILPRIPELIIQFSSSLITDITPSQLDDLVCILNEIPDDKITYAEINEDMVSEDPDDGSMIPDTEEIKEFLREQLED